MRDSKRSLQGAWPSGFVAVAIVKMRFSLESPAGAIFLDEFVERCVSLFPIKTPGRQPIDDGYLQTIQFRVQASGSGRSPNATGFGRRRHATACARSFLPLLPFAAAAVACPLKQNPKGVVGLQDALCNTARLR